MKEDLDYAEAVIGGRFNVFDIIYRGGERPFLAVNDRWPFVGRIL